MSDLPSPVATTMVSSAPGVAVGWVGEERRGRRVAARIAGFRAWAPGGRTATALIVVATVMYPFLTFFARHLTDAGMAPSGVALYRYVLTAALTVRFVRLDPTRRRMTAWAFASGIAMGLGYTAYAAAIEVVEIATVGVIYLTYPMFTILAAWLLFGVRPTLRAALGGLLVVGAALIALDPAATGAHVGVLVLAVAAPLTFGTSIAVLTERLTGLDPFERVGAATAGAVVGLLPLVLRQEPAAILPADGMSVVWIVGLALVTSLIPMTLYALAAPHVGPARSAVAGAVELPTLFVIGLVAFGEPLGWREVLAGAIVVTSIVVSPTRPLPAATAGDHDRASARAPGSEPGRSRPLEVSERSGPGTTSRARRG